MVLFDCLIVAAFVIVFVAVVIVAVVGFVRFDTVGVVLVIFLWPCQPCLRRIPPLLLKDMGMS